MDRKVPFVEGEYYHIYNRGVNRNPIFFGEKDWEYFLKLLYVKNSDEVFRSPDLQKSTFSELNRGNTLVDIVAYALMQNHYHLLLHEKQEGGVSKFMSKLATAYAMHINTKYSRSGPLMCRPFRSSHIHSDEYFRWCVCYIHSNPININIKNGEEPVRLETYKYSSYIDYFVQERDESVLINKSALPCNIANLKTEEAIKKQLHKYEGQLLDN